MRPPLAKRLLEFDLGIVNDQYAIVNEKQVKIRLMPWDRKGMEEAVWICCGRML